MENPNANLQIHVDAETILEQAVMMDLELPYQDAGTVAGRGQEPRANNYASGIGFPCVRRLYYERMEPWEREPFGPDANMRMELGKEFEAYVGRRFAKRGWVWEQQQRRCYISDLKISGKMEGYFRHPTFNAGVPIVFECKAPATYIFNKMYDQASVAENFWGNIWLDQMHVYMVDDGVLWMWLVLVNKEGGKIRVIRIYFDAARWANIGTQAKLTNNACEAGVAPPRCGGADRGEPDVCRWCPFKEHCLPDILNEGGITFLDAPEVVDHLTRLEELAMAKSEIAQLEKWRKGRLKNINDVVVGPFLITGKEISVKAQTKPSPGYSYWKANVQRVKEG